jgi:hypothetical protein
MDCHITQSPPVFFHLLFCKLWKWRALQS